MALFGILTIMYFIYLGGTMAEFTVEATYHTSG